MIFLNILWLFHIPRVYLFLSWVFTSLSSPKITCFWSYFPSCPDFWLWTFIFWLVDLKCPYIPLAYLIFQLGIIFTWIDGLVTWNLHIWGSCLTFQFGIIYTWAEGLVTLCLHTFEVIGTWADGLVTWCLHTFEVIDTWAEGLLLLKSLSPKTHLGLAKVGILGPSNAKREVLFECLHPGFSLPIDILCDVLIQHKRVEIRLTIFVFWSDLA